MKNLVRLLTVLLILAGWGLAAAALHVVRTPGEKQWIVIPKHRLGVDETYVDTRAWTVEDLSTHRGVVQRLVETDKAAALAHVVGTNETEKLVGELTEAIQRGSDPAAGEAKLTAEKQDAKE